MNTLFDDSTNEELEKEEPKKDDPIPTPIKKESNQMITIVLIVLIGCVIAYLAYKANQKED